jgi:hypothetical protein
VVHVIPGIRKTQSEATKTLVKATRPNARKKKNCAAPVPEITPGREVSSFKEDGREKNVEDEFGIELNPVETRNEGHDHTTQNQCDRVRLIEPLGGYRHREGSQQEA